MRKQLKLGVAGFLLMFAVLSGLQMTDKTADACENAACRDGYEVISLNEVSEEETLLAWTKVKYVNTNESYWEKYASDYYYELMSENEKALYDRLAAVCLSYMTGTQDAIADEGGIYRTEMVEYTDLGFSREEAIDLTWMFFYQEAQYYYLKSTIYTSTSGERGSIGFGVYPLFASGTKRESYTEMVEEKLEGWLSEASQKSGEYEKEKVFHDITCREIFYKQNDYSQSIISVILDGESVCAGYSKLFMMLCNASGIETTNITSSNHAWNLIRIGGKWYNVDCTWDDQTSGTIYKFFNLSDSELKAVDEDGQHLYESMWNGKRPSASTTFYDLYPVIKYQKQDGKLAVTITTGTSGAKIYYTTDGTIPTQASSLYNGKIYLENSGKVSAIAVKESVESEIAAMQFYSLTVTADPEGAGTVTGNEIVAEGESRTITATPAEGCQFMGWYENGVLLSREITYTVEGISSDRVITARFISADAVTFTYDVGAGNNNPENPEYLNPGESVVLKAPSRKGYFFKGWYCNGEAVTEISTENGALHLVAKWKKVKVKQTDTININYEKMRVNLKAVKNVDGYQIFYSTDSTFPKKLTMKASAKKNQVKLKKIVSGKVYYLKARAYRLDSAGKKVYSEFCVTRYINP